MKVLVIGINYAPEQTGIAPYTAAMAEGLRDRGHQVRVISGIPHYPQWSNFTGFTGRQRDDVVNGLRVRRVWHKIADGGTGLGRILQEVTFGLSTVLQSWRGADAIVTVSPALISSALVVAKAKLTRRPVGVWVQDLYSNGAKEIGGDGGGLAARGLAVLEAVVLKLADGVLVIHDRFKRSVVDDLKVPAGRVTVSRNWSHLKPAEPEVDVSDLRRRLFGDAPVVALHTGNMGAKQGLENIVEAARVADRTDSDVVFGLVGDGSRKTELQQRGRDVQHLVFVPSLPDEEYRAVLQAADVLLVNEKPGLREMAVPSKLTSYFLQGKPVVAATENDSATADEVAAAGAGPVISPGDPAALLHTVENVAGDDRGHELGESARRFAADHLSAESAIDRVSAWLAALAPRAQSAQPQTPRQ